MDRGSDDYRLLDFGDGRKLEQFGPYVLDRPAPAAEGVSRRDESSWRRADAVFVRGEGDQGTWRRAGDMPESWTISCAGLCLEIKPTPFGHVGFFPEQIANWQWIATQVSQARRPLKVLHLFAHTGGATLAAAAAGAEVVHVDSARNTVGWARRNAQYSGLAEAPIRWIVEDAARFARREWKRGNRYDAVILDPPSFGHGGKRETWKIDSDLPELLRTCAELTSDDRAFLLLTCHTPGFESGRLRSLLAEALESESGARLEAAPLTVKDANGRELPSGYVARWSNRG
ncbi:MAG: class I SAM-dependent methyltransferase [Pirellulaceae bacterium]